MILRNGNTPFKHLNFYIESDQLNWSSLQRMRQLVDIYAEFDPNILPRLNLALLKEQARSSASVTSLFIMSDLRRARFQRALEEALTLGSKAYRGKWMEGMLNSKFYKWLHKHIEEESLIWDEWLQEGGFIEESPY